MGVLVRCSQPLGPTRSNRCCCRRGEGAGNVPLRGGGAHSAAMPDHVTLDVIDRPAAGVRRVVRRARAVRAARPPGLRALIVLGTADFVERVRPAPTPRRLALLAAWEDGGSMWTDATLRLVERSVGSGLGVPRDVTARKHGYDGDRRPPARIAACRACRFADVRVSAVHRALGGSWSRWRQHGSDGRWYGAWSRPSDVGRRGYRTAPAIAAALARARRAPRAAARCARPRSPRRRPATLMRSK